MSIKDLYEIAVKNGFENKPLYVSYQCDDDWYSITEDVEDYMINVEKNEVCIEI